MAAGLKFSLSNVISLHAQQDTPSINIFDKAISVFFFKPSSLHPQNIHERDEMYIVCSGHAGFLNGDKKTICQQGDLLYVPAKNKHEFYDYSADFSTWVIFFDK